MKVLLIGGTGTLSRDTTNLLIKRNHEVYLFNRGNNNASVDGENLNFISGDIYDVEETKKTLKNYYFDVVIDYLVFNLETLKNRVDIFSNITKQYIYISSATVFAPSENCISENSIKGNDDWIYSKRKCECEQYLIDHKNEFGFVYTIVRPYLTYDNRRIPYPNISKVSCWNLLYRIEKSIPIIMCGDGNQKVTVTNTKDFAEGIVGLIQNPKAVNEDFNIVGDTVTTWNDIIRTIEKRLGKKANIIYVTQEESVKYLSSMREEVLFDKGYSHVFNNEKIKAAVPSFTTNYTIEKGLLETIDNLMKNEKYHRFDYRWNIAMNIMCNKYGSCNLRVTFKDKFVNFYYDSKVMYTLRKMWHKFR